MGSDKTVVKNLSLDIYKNQITVLLGHNGAGEFLYGHIFDGNFKTIFNSL